MELKILALSSFPSWGRKEIQLRGAQRFKHFFSRWNTHTEECALEKCAFVHFSALWRATSSRDRARPRSPPWPLPISWPEYRNLIVPLYEWDHAICTPLCPLFHSTLRFLDSATFVSGFNDLFSLLYDSLLCEHTVFSNPLLLKGKHEQRH